MDDRMDGEIQWEAGMVGKYVAFWLDLDQLGDSVQWKDGIVGQVRVAFGLELVQQGDCGPGWVRERLVWVGWLTIHVFFLVFRGEVPG